MDDASLPRQRRIFGVLSPDQERTIRFLLGVGVLVREMLLLQGEPRMLVLFAGGVLVGTPFTNVADDIRKSLTGRGEAK